MHHFPLDQLDIQAPDFPDRCAAWAFQAQRDMHETVASTKLTIADSKALMGEVDQLLANNRPPQSGAVDVCRSGDDIRSALAGNLAVP